jgi:hypothetical protein
MPKKIVDKSDSEASDIELGTSDTDSELEAYLSGSDDEDYIDEPTNEEENVLDEEPLYMLTPVRRQTVIDYKPPDPPSKKTKIELVAAKPRFRPPPKKPSTLRASTKAKPVFKGKIVPENDTLSKLF